MSDLIIADVPELWCNGLRESTKEDLQCYEELASIAMPFTAHWEDANDAVKSFQWDASFDRYIEHCAKLIDDAGRENWLPWNLYNSLGLDWLDGYNFSQGIGNCCGHAHKNSLKASNLTNARRTGRTPREIHLCIAYGIARGNGRMNMGSGLNLNPMAKWAATVGNFWTSDFGRYNSGQTARNWRSGSPACANALKTQSIIVHLPSASFDHVFRACAAGFGITMGTHTFPAASAPNSDGLSVPTRYRNGGHAEAFIAAWIAASGKRYVYQENSHGARYAGDSLHPGWQDGCWIDEVEFRKMAPANVFRWGQWYVNLGEMG